MEAELWKDIPGYGGHYQASDRGRVKSLQRVQRTYGGRQWTSAERILKPTRIERNGYMVVSMCMDGATKRRYVHDLVLTAFVGPRPSPGSHCCHGKEGPGVNAVGNLRWDSPGANVEDKREHGTMPLGVQHWKNVYSEEQILSVKRLLEGGHSPSEAAKETGVNVATVRQVKANRQWSHLSLKPTFSSL